MYGIETEIRSDRVGQMQCNITYTWNLKAALLETETGMVVARSWGRGRWWRKWGKLGSKNINFQIGDESVLGLTCIALWLYLMILYYSLESC